MLNYAITTFRNTRIFVQTAKHTIYNAKNHEQLVVETALLIQTLRGKANNAKI